MKNSKVALSGVSGLMVAMLMALSVARPVHAQAYTWTNTTTGAQSWTTAGNWSVSTQFVSGAGNELIFFSDSTTNIAVIAQTFTSVPTTLSMNTLTLNGKGASSGASSSSITVGTGSTWTLGDGTISTVNLNGNFGATAAAGWNYVIAANLTLNQASTLFTGGGTGGFTFSGSIGQAATGYGITKSGTSLLTLSGGLSFTGDIAVTNGTLVLAGGNMGFTGNMSVSGSGVLQIGNNTATQLNGATYAGNISVPSTATLRYQSSSNQTFSGIISGSGGLTKSGTGTLTLSDLNTYTGKTFIAPTTGPTSAGTLSVSSFDYITSGSYSNHGLGSSLGAPTSVANGTVDLGAGIQATAVLKYAGATASGETTDRVINIVSNGSSTRTLDASGSGLLRFTSAFTSNASGSGAFILTGTGTGQIDQGLPQLTTAGLDKQGTGTWTLGGSGSFTGPTKITAGILSLSSATALQNSTFDTTNSVAGSASAGLSISPSTLTLAGLTGTNALAGRFATSGGYSSLTALTLNSLSGATSTYSGAIVNGASGMTLTKSGPGTQFLNGANSYTGLTTVNAGTLGSSGSFSGAVTITDANLSPGASAGAIGTLTISDASASALTLNSSRLLIDLPNSGASDLIAITGNLVLNGNNTVVPNIPAAGVGTGTYTLMSYAATTGSGSVVFSNGLTTLGNATLAVGTTSTTLTVGAGGLNQSLWTGASGAWDGVTTNWTRNGTTLQSYVDGDLVTFDDTGTTLTVTSTGTVLPSMVTFSNTTTKTYIINATIGGTGTPVVKTGNGTVTLGGTNTYSGATVLSAGTLIFTANANLGASGTGITFNGSATIQDNTGTTLVDLGTRPFAISNGVTATINLASRGNLTIGGAITGSGNIASSASTFWGKLRLDSTSNTFTGSITNSNAQDDGSAATPNSLFSINSIADGVGYGNIILNSGQATVPQGIDYGTGGASGAGGGGATSALTLNNRQIAVATNNLNLLNNSSNQSLTINTDIGFSGAGARKIQFGLNTRAGSGVNTFAGKLTDNAGSALTVLFGGGVWTISGNNTYTGGTTISAGTLNVNSASALGTGTFTITAGTINNNSGSDIVSTTNNPQAWNGDFTFTGTNNLNLGTGAVALSATRQVTVSAGNLTVGGAISGVGFGLTKAGPGTLTLAGASTYNGTTTINSGTLVLSGGSNRLLSTGTLAFAGNSTFDIGSTSQTLAAITVPNAGANTTITSTVNGSGGTLTINGASNLEWGQGGVVPVGTTTTSAVNLSGLSNFVFNAPSNTFRVGYKTGTSNGATIDVAFSTVTLAASNTIAAAVLAVGDNVANNHGGTSTLRLGTANILNIGSINVGFAGRSHATLNFLAGSSAVTIRNTDGISAVSSWNIGAINTPNALVFTDSVNLSNGTVDALVTSMVIGQANPGSGTNRTGTTNASFTMAGGTLTTGTMNLGQFLGNSGSTVTSTMAANGTFTLNSASGTVNVTTLNLATNTTLSTGGTRTVSGTFNLTNGTLNATTVQKGDQTGGTATATVAFNWATGTISNLTGTNLTWTGIPITLTSGTHTFDISGSNTATLDTNTIIGGGAFGISKAGTGTMTLSGTNTYTGTTTINNGTLSILSPGSLASGSAVTINGNSVAGFAAAQSALRGTGIVNGTVTAAGTTITNNADAVVWPGTFNDPTSLNTNQVLTVNNTVNLSAYGKLAVVFNNADKTQSLTATNLTLGGTSVLSLSFDAVASGKTYTIVNTPNGLVSPFAVVLGISGYVADGVSHTMSADIVYADGTNTYINPAPGNFSPALSGATTIKVIFNTGVTPVKVADFSAKAEVSGVNVSWTAVSEYQNAGFDIYRRALESAEWVKVNPTLISGRITNADEKKYTYFDFAPAGMYEYKLESIDLSGGREVYSKLSEIVDVDWNSEFAPATVASVDVVDSAVRSIDMAFSAETAQRVEAMFAAERVSVPTVVLNSKVDNKVAVREIAARSVANVSVASNVQIQSPAVGVRWFSAGRVAASSSYTAAKVSYKNAGVMLIPQASMPEGFDLNNVTLQREGRSMNALAKVAAGLLVYAPGYKDDYTDKDAIFLRKTTTPTNAGTPTNASGLFTSALPVNVTSSNTVTNAYHDVYFDYNLRPYSFEPWFSNKYLTQGSTQDFNLNLADVVGSSSTMTVNVWSLTSHDGVNPDHGIQVLINGQAVGETSWDGGGKMVQLTFAVPTGALKSGSNVVSLVTPNIAGLDIQIAFVHSISFTYTRGLNVSTPVEITNTSSTASIYELYNVPSTGAWVVDARFSDRASLVPTETQVQNDGTLRLRFVAQAGGSGKYIVVPSGKENAPLNVSARQVKALKLNGTYMATGPAQFASGVQPLLMKRAKEGIRGVYVDQEQLFDYYNYGRFGPDGIRKAVRSTKPTYLLLTGRTTYDYLNYEGQNIDPLCPAYLVSTNFWAQTTSDSTFGDLGRGYPEVAVGRLPVNNTSELAGAINHIVNYKGIPQSGIRLHAVADRADPLVADFGAQLDAMIKAYNPEIGWQENYLAKTYASAPEVTSALKDAANGGADLILYSGHGNAARLGAMDPRILDQTSVQSWTGNTVFLQSTCTANWMAKNVDDYKSIAIQALTQAQGGISASIGTSTYMNPDVATAFMNQVLKNASGTNVRWGSVLLKSQQWAGSQTGSPFYKDLMVTEQLFGDPAMPVFTPKLSTQSPSASSNAAGTF